MAFNNVTYGSAYVPNLYYICKIYWSISYATIVWSSYIQAHKNLLEMVQLILFLTLLPKAAVWQHYCKDWTGELHKIEKFTMFYKMLRDIDFCTIS